MSKEIWHFDPDNEGNSFLNGYGLLDQDGMEIGVFIETGDDFNDEEQRAKAYLVAAAGELRDALIDLEAELCFRFSAHYDRAPGYMNAELRGKVLAARAAIFKSKGPPAAEAILERMRRHEGLGKGEGIKT